MRNLLLATTFVVLWSSGFVGAALGADAGPVPGVLALRYLSTAALLLVVVSPRVRHLSAREVGQQMVLGLLAHVVFLGGVFGANGAEVDAGTVALVCALQPMLVVAAGRLFWGDRVRATQVLGLGVGLAAVGITVGGAAPTFGTVALPVVALVGLSGSALLERRWRPTTDVVAGLAVQVVVGAAVFATYALATGSLTQVSASTDLAVALVWLLLSGLGGYSMFVLCLRRLGASRTSTLLYLTPAVTTFWVWPVLGDAPTTSSLVGLVVGAVAVGLVLRGGRQTKTATARAAEPRCSYSARNVPSGANSATGWSPAVAGSVTSGRARP